MNRLEVSCPNCEAEFYIETSEPIEFCACCGDRIEVDEGDFDTEE